MFLGINAIEFARKFQSNEDCFNYLIEMKWGKGFKCGRCGHQLWIKGNSWLERRCKSCNYNESVTAKTLFHGCRTGILKAFHMAFRVSCKKKGISTVELATEVGVAQKTAWLFKRKLQIAMYQSEDMKLNGKVDVDETLLGYHTDRAHCGRNLEERKAVMIAVEVLEKDKTGNIRLKKIDNFRAETLKAGIEEMTSPDAQTTTDDFKSYLSLKLKGMELNIVPSTQLEKHAQINRQIMVFKHWLTGTHHKWSEQHLSAYTDEHVFRFNNRNCRRRIFHKLIERIMSAKPHSYAVITGART